MENLTLIERFANPDLIHSMSMGEKLLASTYVAILGMAITFIALIILWGCILIMSNMLNTKKPKKEAVQVAKSTPAPQPAVVEEPQNNEELIAVITAAIAASLNTTTHNIIVKNILRVSDRSPAWNRAGRVEQMNRML